jgi:hypothetical protein
MLFKKSSKTSKAPQREQLERKIENLKGFNKKALIALHSRCV